MNGTFIIAVIIILLITILISKVEGFWGSTMPVPYMGQPLTQYGRSGIDAATDAPKMFIDPNACPVSPYYCQRCRGYRCCCT